MAVEAPFQQLPAVLLCCLLVLAPTGSRQGARPLGEGQGGLGGTPAARLGRQQCCPPGQHRHGRPGQQQQRLCSAGRRRQCSCGPGCCRHCCCCCRPAAPCLSPQPGHEAGGGQPGSRHHRWARVGKTEAALVRQLHGVNPATAGWLVSQSVAGLQQHWSRGCRLASACQPSGITCNTPPHPVCVCVTLLQT